MPLVKSLPGFVRIINQLLQHTVYGVIYSENVYIYFIVIILFVYTSLYKNIISLSIGKHIILLLFILKQMSMLALHGKEHVQALRLP